MAAFIILGRPAFTQRVEERITTTFVTQPRPQLTVTNNYSSPITGLLVENKVTSPDGRERGSLITAFDPTTHDARYRLIATGESQTFPIGNFEGSDPAALNPQVKAVIFDDNTSFGNSAWVKELRNRRRCHLAEITNVTALLTRAKQQALDNAAVVSLLKQRTEDIVRTIPNNPGVTTNQCRTAASVIANSVRADFEANIQRGGPESKVVIPHAISVLQKHRDQHADLKH